MKAIIFIVILLFMVLVGCLCSCTKDKATVVAVVNCTGVNALTNTYNLNISPNITGVYCAIPGCHGGGSSQLGVDLSTYASTVSAFKNHDVICDLKNAGCPLMPYGGPPLADSLILQIQCWQANGFSQ